MPQVTVPNLVGLTQSEAQAKLTDAKLVAGPTTQVASDKPSASVVSTNPVPGAVANEGNSVSLQVSSGSASVSGGPASVSGGPAAASGRSAAGSGGPAQVAVPSIIGLTQPAAEALLKKVGLTVGTVKKHRSNSVAAGGISGADRDAGALVSPGTPVNLEISKGPETGWTYYIPVVFFCLLGLGVLWIISNAITQTNLTFLLELAKPDVARGLITFLIAITTVGIAIILAVSTLILSEGDAGDKRFDRGKQVLTTLIGVLGTIVGFYFGSANMNTPEKPPTEQTKITTTSLPEGAVNKPYPSTVMQTAGLTPPLKWTVAPPLPAGLTLDAATGTIGGTPTAAVPKTSYKFTVTDSAVPPVSSPKALDLEVK